MESIYSLIKEAIFTSNIEYFISITNELKEYKLDEPLDIVSTLTIKKRLG